MHKKKSTNTMYRESKEIKQETLKYEIKQFLVVMNQKHTKQAHTYNNKEGYPINAIGKNSHNNIFIVHGMANLDISHLLES